ncbi:hypothetical protein FHX44_116075 [Pseudonocardia hierapolitana]|uniref:DUF4203 domain-containing protein n=1 Tax=Pseudonocardia hierapolitana TaxID=1128676 RepID=A0A561SZ52_9PSEU|nr:hypothetical protein [Pseudonocardia hierapolitana]TWF80137.1 hypothetical protein FHX44_116075 [Pseudonocardia hierapolitana]
MGIALLIAGMLLCFVGARSLVLAAACAGFGLGSGLAAALGGGAVTAVLVGVGGGVGAVLLVRLALGTGPFVVGALAGGVVAASAYRTLPPTLSWPAPLVVLVVLAVAVLSGAAVHFLRAPLLRAVTALAGAGLIIRGVVEAGPAFLGFLRSPATWVESLVALAALLALAWVGFTTQRQRVDKT